MESGRQSLSDRPQTSPLRRSHTSPLRRSQSSRERSSDRPHLSRGYSTDRIYESAHLRPNSMSLSYSSSIFLSSCLITMSLMTSPSAPVTFLHFLPTFFLPPLSPSPHIYRIYLCLLPVSLLQEIITRL